MPAKMIIYETREAWLRGRAGRIGGSEAASLVGRNPWRTNVELWEEKTGLTVPEDISNSPYVKYGSDAEQYLRGLFALDFPQYKVEYVENNMWLNDKYPFAHASLDGWTHDEQGRLGILEIKTTNIVNPAQKAKWDNRIPDNYYCQVCWYMGILEADYADLKAQLKWGGDSPFLVTKHYHMERSDMEGDIKFLLEKGAEFAELVRKGVRPPLVLPEI